VHRTIAGGLTVRVGRAGDVLVLTGTGTFTLETSAGLREFVRAELARRDARAMVGDFRGVLFLLSQDGWSAAADGTIRAARRGIRVPIAFVVDPMAVDPAERYCQRLADHGHLRLVFTEYERAVSWASRRMEHWDWAPAAQPS